ncbi:MAG: hypothetical protein K6B75_03855, partial [Lachnospiraceae bacterium]|nr:hypothetical protein [Lachnospiraceae bacterium]
MNRNAKKRFRLVSLLAVMLLATAGCFEKDIETTSGKGTGITLVEGIDIEGEGEQQTTPEPEQKQEQGTQSETETEEPKVDKDFEDKLSLFDLYINEYFIFDYDSSNYKKALADYYALDNWGTE